MDQEADLLRRTTGHTTGSTYGIHLTYRSEKGSMMPKIRQKSPTKSRLGLLTDPRYFNEVLALDRSPGKLLLEGFWRGCSDKVMHQLGSVNCPKSRKQDRAEQQRKVIQARRTEINKELEKIPVRIDEGQAGRRM